MVDSGWLGVVDQSEGETAADGTPRKIIIWKDRNKSVQLLNVCVYLLLHVMKSVCKIRYSEVF